MGLPTITSNSPSAGYIAWTASKITFGGQTYPIPAGNTNKKFVYWDQSASTPGALSADGTTLTGGSSTLVSVDVLPGQAGDGSTTWDPNDYLLFMNKAGVGVLVDKTAVVDGSLIVTGSILADAIGANQVTAGKIDADVVTAREIHSDTITGDKIKANQIAATHMIAGSIGTNQLSVGTFGDNLIPNPYFEDWVTGNLMPDGWGLVTGSGFAGATATKETAATITGSTSLGLQPSVGNQAAATTINRIAARPGEDIAFEAYYAGTGSAATGGVAIGIYYYDASGAFISSQQTNGNVTGGSTIDYVSHVSTAPVNAKFMQPILVVGAQQKVLWDELRMQQRVTGVLIKDNTITAAKLTVGAINVGGSDRVTFAPGYDPSSKASITDVTNLEQKATSPDGYAPNPFFDKWTGTAPDNYTTAAGTPVKETVLARTAPNSLRYNVTAGTAAYVQPTTNYLGDSTFITVTADVYLVSGDWSGSGILARWYNTAPTSFDAIVDFNSTLSGKPTGAWYRVQQVVPKPGGFSGTFSKIEIWPMGGWATIGAITAKNIIFDQLNARPSTVEEIKAYTAGLWTYPGTTKINGGLIQTGTITADFVAANVSITSPIITSGQFTGAIRTSAVGQGRAEVLDGTTTFPGSGFTPTSAGLYLFPSGTTYDRGAVYAETSRLWLESPKPTSSYTGRASLQLNSTTSGRGFLELDGCNYAVFPRLIAAPASTDVVAMSATAQGSPPIQSTINLSNYVIGMDDQRVQAYNGNTPSTLSLNPFGGGVTVGTNTTINGTTWSTGLLTASAGANVSGGLLTAGSGLTVTGTTKTDTLRSNTAGTSVLMADPLNLQGNTLFLSGGTITGGGGTITGLVSIQSSNPNLQLNSGLSMNSNPIVGVAGLTVASGGLNVTGGTTTAGGLTVTGGGATVTGNSTFSADLKGAALYMTDTTTTTTNAINTNTNSSGGRILRSTASARRFKTNIRPLEVDKKAVLGLQQVVFNYIPEHYSNPDEDVPGFIADDAEAAGQHFLVQYDDAGELETFRYDRLGIFHHAILRDHDESIHMLKAEIAELRAQLT